MISNNNVFNLYDNLIDKGYITTKDIINLGFRNQVIDFGHFDIQYEFYLRNVTKKIRIPIAENINTLLWETIKFL